MMATFATLFFVPIVYSTLRAKHRTQPKDLETIEHYGK